MIAKKENRKLYFNWCHNLIAKISQLILWQSLFLQCYQKLHRLGEIAELRLAWAGEGPIPIYTPGWSEEMEVKCLSQEHNTML